jgi:hypothetical protein
MARLARIAGRRPQQGPDYSWRRARYRGARTCRGFFTGGPARGELCLGHGNDGLRYQEIVDGLAPCWSPRCARLWMPSTRTRNRRTPLRDTPICTEGTSLTDVPGRGSSHGAGCTSSGRLSSPSSCTSPFRGALILDNRVANAVHDRSRLPHLVTPDRRSVAWTPYRYAVYLHWMRQIAQTIGTRPEMLEFTLFQAPADPMAEHDADE